MARTSHQGKITLAMAFGMKWRGAVWNTTFQRILQLVLKTEDYLTQAYLFCTLPSIKVWGRKLTVVTIFEQKRKRVLVMLQGDCGAALEFSSRRGRMEWGDGWRSRWREWGATLWGVDITRRSRGEWEMGKKQRKETRLWLISFQGEWTVTVMQDLGWESIVECMCMCIDQRETHSQ